jgi:hypothetical protein
MHMTAHQWSCKPRISVWSHIMQWSCKPRVQCRRAVAHRGHDDGHAQWSQISVRANHRMRCMGSNAWRIVTMHGHAKPRHMHAGIRAAQRSSVHWITCCMQASAQRSAVQCTGSHVAFMTHLVVGRDKVLCGRVDGFERRWERNLCGPCRSSSSRSNARREQHKQRHGVSSAKKADG